MIMLLEISSFLVRIVEWACFEEAFLEDQSCFDNINIFWVDDQGVINRHGKVAIS